MIIKKTNNNPPDLQIENTLKDLIMDKMSVNNQGFFIKNLGTRQELRTIASKEAEAFLSGLEANNLIVHSRLATTGIVNVDNVHGWQIGNYQFAHNGQVFDYADTGTYDHKTRTWTKELSHKADSLKLFEKLVSRITAPSTKKIAKAIRASVYDVGFWGRAALYDISNDKMFVFGDWQMYLVNNEYLIFSSSALDFENSQVIKTHGLNFQQQISNIQKLEFDGLAVIENFVKESFNFRNLGVLETTKTTKITTTYQDTNFEHDKQYGRYDDDLELERELDVVQTSFYMLNKSDEIVECIMDFDGIVHDKMRLCCNYDECDMFFDYPVESNQRSIVPKELPIVKGVV